MKTNRAFTLIEVMVVLSILAIIAILAYNYFGSTMKEAKLKQVMTSIYNQSRVLGDALDLMYLKDPASKTNGNKVTTLVTGGHLKSAPHLDGSNCPGGTCYWEAYYHYDDMDNQADGEEALTGVYPVTREICDAFNAEYSSLTEPWEYNMSGGEAYNYPVNETIYCLDWGAGAAENYQIMFVMGYDMN